MCWISKLKDKTYYIDFDSGYVYEGDNVVAEITSPIQIRILHYFADHPEKWLEKDGIIENCWPDITGAENISDNTFYNRIHSVKRIHIKIDESIESRRGMGYKYHGLQKEKKSDGAAKKPDGEGHALREAESDSDGQAITKDEVNTINLASLLIHRNDRDHPKIAEDLELEIRYIIGLLEQGLSEDFEEACEQAWESLNLMQKALRIFKAYENLTRGRNMSPTDTNSRL